MSDEQRCGTDGWKGRERRRTPEMTLDELHAHIDIRVARALRDHEDRMTRRLDMRFDELRELLRSAFPEGDPAAHRRAHEEMIDLVRTRKQFFNGLLQRIAGWLAVVMLTFLGLSVWKYTSSSVHRDSPYIYQSPRIEDRERRNEEPLQ